MIDDHNMIGDSDKLTSTTQTDYNDRSTTLTQSTMMAANDFNALTTTTTSGVEAITITAADDFNMINNDNG